MYKSNPNNIRNHFREFSRKRKKNKKDFEIEEENEILLPLKNFFGGKIRQVILGGLKADPEMC